MGLSISDTDKILDALSDRYSAKIISAQKNNPVNIKKIVIDLTTAQLDTSPYILQFPFTSLYVADATSSDVSVNIKFFSRDLGYDSIPLRKYDRIDFPYPCTDIFIDWAAQSGRSITLVFFSQDTQFVIGNITNRPEKSNLPITVTPTIDTAIYASGDRMGSIMTLTSATRSGFDCTYLMSVSGTDNTKQSAFAFRINFYNALPTIASADNAAFDLTDAENLKYIGHVDIAAGDWSTDSASNGSFVTKGINLGPLRASLISASDLYAVCVSKGTPTFVSTTALQLTFNFLQDR